MAIISIGCPSYRQAVLSVLRESRIKIYNAFAIGSQALTEFRYEEVQAQLLLIRDELSKVAAVRAMSLLVGEITLVNLDEDINNALVFLSKGCGAVYGLQFTLQYSGNPYLSYEEATHFIAQLTVPAADCGTNSGCLARNRPKDLSRMWRRSSVNAMG
ncbi:DUF4856 domain-containing protein [Bacteroides ovatus]|nr:DUF4856 domain-containing protein [Bacteroides ovatus]